jgi:hypothetical protein
MCDVEISESTLKHVMYLPSGRDSYSSVNSKPSIDIGYAGVVVIVNSFVGDDRG